MRRLVHLLVLMIRPPRKARLLADLQNVSWECYDLQGQLQHNDYVWDQYTKQLQHELDDCYQQISTAREALHALRQALYAEACV